MKKRHEWVTEDEIATLAHAFLKTRGKAGGSEDEIVKVVEWACNTRCRAALLDMVLKGHIVITAVEPDVTFTLAERPWMFVDLTVDATTP